MDLETNIVSGSDISYSGSDDVDSKASSKVEPEKEGVQFHFFTLNEKK